MEGDGDFSGDGESRSGGGPRDAGSVDRRAAGGVSVKEGAELLRGALNDPGLRPVGLKLGFGPDAIP